MESIPLAAELADLLQGHGVTVQVADARVHLPELGLAANLWLAPTASGTFLLELRATTPGGPVLADRCVAIGASPQEARLDGLRSFCQGSFHVLLAALWGVLERDQVDHEVRVIGARAWDVYLGPCTLRTSVDTPRLTMPVEIVEDVLRLLEPRLGEDGVHGVRVYVGAVNGSVTVEAVFDDQPWPELESRVRAAPWSFPAKGFSSLRWFLAVRSRHDNAPSHQHERLCSGG